MRSADSAALAKLYTKASLRPAGPAGHLHGAARLRVPRARRPPQPLAALRGRRQRRSSATSPGCCPRSAAQAIAGVVALLPELLAMAAPYPNSLPPLRAGKLGAHDRDLGHGQLQLCPPGGARSPGSARLELRVPGADTSPHHCLAMFLGAALWGIEERLEPPPPVDRTGRRSSCASGGSGLPRDLVEAAERFSASAAARELFGPAFVEHYAAARQAEAAACHRFVSTAGTGPLHGLCLRRMGRRRRTIVRADRRADRRLRPRRLRRRRDLIDPALARRALDRYEDLFAGRFETGLYPDEWNWRPGVHRADLTRQICNGWKSDRDIARCRAAARHRARLRPPRRVARRAAQPGQRAVEAAWRQGPRLPPGLELRAVGRALGMGQLLDRPRGHHVGPGHGRVRARARTAGAGAGE